MLAKFNGGEVPGCQSIERNQTKFNSDKNNRAIELNQSFEGSSYFGAIRVFFMVLRPHNMIFVQPNLFRNTIEHNSLDCARLSFVAM